MRTTLAPDRLQEAFRALKAQGRVGIIPFVTVGFPDVATTLELAPALARAGADVIELGVPFSDPLADGATIQKASFHALRQGVTLSQCLRVCSTLRQNGLKTPLVLMGYYNPLLSFGLKHFAADARAAGVDGVIVADMPAEESGPLHDECTPQGLHLICLLAPTSTEARIAAACAAASGFIYCVSLAGVTGARTRISPDVIRLVQRVRVHTGLPIAVGFGLSRREHVEAVGKYADAAIVGSALLNVMESAPPGKVVDHASRFLADLRGAPQSIARGMA
ncbi:MAG: tryptophan synthase subunit alpha [Chloroflexi bacterium]|nr:tryptophan synthase subunit alpha [Chloroflexota bacterium]